MFVEQMSPSSLNLNELLLQGKLSLNDKLACILQISRAAIIIPSLGLLHDFSLSNMTFDGKKIRLYNFVNKVRSTNNAEKDVEAKVKEIISQMITVSDKL
jgi:hypothetical protein